MELCFNDYPWETGSVFRDHVTLCDNIRLEKQIYDVGHIAWDACDWYVQSVAMLWALPILYVYCVLDIMSMCANAKEWVKNQKDMSTWKACGDPQAYHTTT